MWSHWHVQLSQCRLYVTVNTDGVLIGELFSLLLLCVFSQRWVFMSESSSVPLLCMLDLLIVFGRFDLAALCGCHTLNVCYVMLLFVCSSSWLCIQLLNVVVDSVLLTSTAEHLRE